MLSFLSPITPQSTIRQAIPAAYLSVSVEGSHDLEVYIDINGLWATGDRESKLDWEFLIYEPSITALKTWKFARQDQLLFTEFSDRSEWGTVYFSASQGVRHECGTAGSVRTQFAGYGQISDRMDTRFREVMDDEPVFAFSKEFFLGNTDSMRKRDSVVFTIAHLQDSVAQFASADGLAMMSPTVGV